MADDVLLYKSPCHILVKVVHLIGKDYHEEEF